MGVAVKHQHRLPCGNINKTSRLLTGKMLQRYSMHLQIYLLRKKYHTAFQAPLLGINDPSDDANKHQQAFLAPLP
jgi:hypothetical protein